MSVGERAVSEINNSKLVCQCVSASLECPWARRMGANNEKSRSSTTVFYKHSGLDFKFKFSAVCFGNEMTDAFT